MSMTAFFTQSEIASESIEASTDPDIYAMLKATYTLCIENQ